MGTGQKLWQRAKNVIPGGNMLLSKRPEMFLPDNSAYFKKTQGCRVWDLDANEYIDKSLMGVGEKPYSAIPTKMLMQLSYKPYKTVT